MVIGEWPLFKQKRTFGSPQISSALSALVGRLVISQEPGKRSNGLAVPALRSPIMWVWLSVVRISPWPRISWTVRISLPDFSSSVVKAWRKE